MPISAAERQAIVEQCNKFFGYRPANTFAERMQEIVQSEYAKIPLDHYGNGGFVTLLEQEVAELLGHEAAVFMPSGTMAQQIALRIWCDQAGSKLVAFHPLSHLEIHEQKAYQELHGLAASLLGTVDRLFTLDDLKSLAEKPAAILIELPQREIGGQLPNWEELSVISEWCRANGIKVHIDGARLWECQPFYDRPYAEISGLFDSVYVSFYKILGGLPGAMLAGPADFIQESRNWLRRHGGNLYTSAPSAISAKLGMEKQLPKISEFVKHAQAIAAALNDLEGFTVVPHLPPTNMMHWHFTGDKNKLENALYKVAQESGLLLFRGLTATANPNVWKVEVSVQSQNLCVTAEEIRSGIEQILILAN